MDWDKNGKQIKKIEITVIILAVLFLIFGLVSDARISQNITQKELAERTGIAQTEISKLENGTRNPSIKLLQRLADGMDMVLNISFTPKSSVRK